MISCRTHNKNVVESMIRLDPKQERRLLDEFPRGTLRFLGGSAGALLYQHRGSTACSEDKTSSSTATAAVTIQHQKIDFLWVRGENGQKFF